MCIHCEIQMVLNVCAYATQSWPRMFQFLMWNCGIVDLWMCLSLCVSIFTNPYFVLMRFCIYSDVVERITLSVCCHSQFWFTNIHIFNGINRWKIVTFVHGCKNIPNSHFPLHIKTQFTCKTTTAQLKDATINKKIWATTTTTTSKPVETKRSIQIIIEMNSDVHKMQQ